MLFEHPLELFGLRHVHDQDPVLLLFGGGELAPYLFEPFGIARQQRDFGTGAREHEGDGTPNTLGAPAHQCPHARKAQLRCRHAQLSGSKRSSSSRMAGTISSSLTRRTTSPLR
jgi:hypothetical protein